MHELTKPKEEERVKFKSPSICPLMLGKSLRCLGIGFYPVCSERRVPPCRSLWDLKRKKEGMVVT